MFCFINATPSFRFLSEWAPFRFLTHLGEVEGHVDLAGDGEVVLHDERDHLRGVLGGIDVPRQSEGFNYSFMSLKYIFILFDHFCTL